MAQLYPAWAEDRLRRIVALRGRGVRSERELRWWLWFEGGDDLWPPVQQDLLAAYPRTEQAAVEVLADRDPETLEGAVDQAATVLAASWDSSDRPGYDRRRVRTATEGQDLAMITIEIATGDALDLDARLDDQSEERTRDLLDRAWGEGSADAAHRMATAGVGHPATWEEAIRVATAAEAHVVAGLIGRAMSAERVIAEARRFEADWADRSLLIGASLYAVRLGVSPPTR
ncbi:MAG TPA: hypothetical protein VKR30_04790 [Candidatus Limnocylindrales bacterium]|nr:hypothetical protein [Candidatus Limnocylindrales bacterium]